MDPVSAIGVAAAAVQFTEIAIKITNRIAVFTILHDIPKHAEGPRAFVERLRSQLGLLNSTIRRIKDGITSFQEGLQGNELLELGNYISNLNRHGERLGELLNKYLPDDDASTPTRLLAALKSIASDVEIESVMGSINELLPLLTTFLLTSMAFKAGFDFTESSGLRNGTDFGQRHSNSGAIYQVSRHEVRHFVDRPELLTQIDRLLNDERTRPPRIVVLQGMGGQGKTQLALRYCGTARFQNNFHCILWVDASTKASTIRGLEGIAEELNDTNEALTSTDARVAFVRRKLAVETMKWLLVFDNYDDPAAFDLRDYVPQGPLGNVLITSRSTDADRIGAMIRISGMTEDEAISLLFKQIDIPEDAINRFIATEIVRRLGYLPLAIDQAGAYIKTEGLPLARFLEHYERSARDILGSVPTLWEYTESAPSQDGVDIAKTAFTTWNLSFTLLQPNTSLGALKVKVLSILAFFDEHEILEEYIKNYYTACRSNQQPDWMSLFTEGEEHWSSRKFDSVMREFSRLSLITSLDTERRDTESAIISLHPLVRDWINLRQDHDTHRANFEIYTRILVATLSPNIWEELSSFMVGYRIPDAQCRRLSGHVISWLKVSGQHISDISPIIITPEHEGFLKVATAEWYIVVFLISIGHFESGYELAHWLWESYDVSDSQLVRVKFDIGNREIICLRGLRLVEEAKASSREKLQYWRTILGTSNSNDEILDMALMMVIQSLNLALSRAEKQEVISLCTTELERIPNNEANMHKRHTFLSEILYAAEVLGWDDVCRETFETMMAEMTRNGENDYRRMNWSSRSWYDVTWYSIRCCNDANLIDLLSQAALESIEERFGVESADFVLFRILKGQALASMGRLLEAEVLQRDCIATVMSGSFDRSIYGEAYEKLGLILYRQQRYEEAYDAYNLALLQYKGPEIHVNKLRILNSCGEAARKFNLELADTHFTLKYSLFKETDVKDGVINDIVKLSQLKAQIGNEVAARGALEILAEGLETYGIELIYRKDSAPRTHLREINATINLEDSELLKWTRDSSVYTLLTQKLGQWRGLDLLMQVSLHLLMTGDVDTAEQAFHLAKNIFDDTIDSNRTLPSIGTFITWVFHYTERRFQVDGDKRRVRDIMDWAAHHLHSKPMNVDGEVSPFHPWNLHLLDLIETPAEHAKRKGSDMMHRLSNRFSRVFSLKTVHPSLLRSGQLSRRDIRPTHSIADSTATPAYNPGAITAAY